VDCHSGKQFTDSALNVRHDIGTVKATTGKRLNATLDGLDTPTLLSVWQTAPYLHDGSAKTLEEAIQAHHSASNLSNDTVIHLANYLKQLDNDAKENFKDPPVKPPVKAAGGTVFIPLLFLLFIMVTRFRNKGLMTINLT
jgi:cytochrome c peroxidase